MSHTPKAWRNDAEAKVTGRAKYADDFKFHNLLHAVPVYSDYVHAKIKSIDTKRAELCAGVVRVITHKDVPGSITFGQIIKDYHMFADDKIRYNGDVVAMVVAETREQAIAASKLVSVDADILPAVLDPEEALKPGAPLIHESRGNNVVNEHCVRLGDTKAAFAKCDHILEHTFQTQFIEHAYLEPESGVAVPRSDGVIEIYGSMQHPFSTRRFTAALLGVKLSMIDVKTIAVGGGFGGKDDTAALVCARAALAAKLTGCPVKMTYDREWSVRESYKRHPYRIDYKLGFNNDGLMQAVEARMIADAGAYCSVTPWVTWRSTVQCCGCYKVPNVHTDVIGVYTNNVFTGAMRGFGSPQVNFVIEQLMEMAAQKIGISGIEMRRRNLMRQGDTTITGQVLNTHKVSLEEAFNSTLNAIEYEAKYKKCAHGQSDSDELYGIGVALSYRGMSLGAEGMDFNAAIVNVQFDGSILVEAAVHENGQGSESAMILILAEELGVSKDRIRYRQSSTSQIPDGGTTVASRGTLMGGGAVANAARELKKKLSGLLAPKLNCRPEDVRFQNDCIYGKTDADKLTFEQGMRELFLIQEFPYAFGTFQAPKVSWNEHNGQGDAYFTWVYGCQAVELTVNKKTGKVKLLNMVASHEVGKAINREMVLGQFFGGMAMATGYGLFEEVKMDGGKVTSLNYRDYHIASAAELPDMKAIIIENADPRSPTGAKGIGEPTNELMAPAIANAIANATGKRYFKLPIKVQV